MTGIVGFAMVRGDGLLHGLQETPLVAVFALPAAQPAVGRRARSAAAVLGLITASAVIVHLSGGVVEAHFHFFVMAGVTTLYQDWPPFGLALAFGLASWDFAEAAPELVERAERALYPAKAEGRTRFVTA